MTRLPMGPAESDRLRISQTDPPPTTPNKLEQGMVTRPTKRRAAVFSGNRWTGPGTDWLIVDTTTQIAQLLSVSAATVETWKKQGMPREANGTFDLRDVLQWYKQFLLRDNDHAGG